VIQPDRNTSATPEIVSSSIVGRVSGKYGTAGLRSRVVAVAAGADMLRLVAEEGVVAGFRDQMITERGISNSGSCPCSALPPTPAASLPKFAKLSLFHETPARPGRRILLQLKLALDATTSTTRCA